MNVILVDPQDFVSPERVSLEGDRLSHIRNVLRAAPGDSVVVGAVGGKLGRGRIVELSEVRVLLDVVFDRDPPRAFGVTLAVALPRPPTLRKVLWQAASLGVKRIALFGSARVEKSYWQSRGLEAAALTRQLRLGLEQALDTIVPEVELHRRFRPFVEDRLPELAPEILLADPAVNSPCPTQVVGPVTLVVGPEGGLLPFEVERLLEQGARPVALGARTLRVETAVVALLGRLGPP